MKSLLIFFLDLKMLPLGERRMRTSVLTPSILWVYCLYSQEQGRAEWYLGWGRWVLN